MSESWLGNSKALAMFNVVIDHRRSETHSILQSAPCLWGSAVGFSHVTSGLRKMQISKVVSEARTSSKLCCRGMCTWRITQHKAVEGYGICVGLVFVHTFQSVGDRCNFLWCFRADLFDVGLHNVQKQSMSFLSQVEPRILPSLSSLESTHSFVSRA